jgi:hypothetical protein
MPDDARIQGSCCSPMDLHRYQEQVEGLKKYAEIPQIPNDPYDVPVKLAKQLFENQKAIQLTPNQQVIYDQAMQISEEGGPYCCRCWRWFAFEGQAKYLITELDWSAQQVAELWDLEDGCGGPEHEHN